MPKGSSGATSASMTTQQRLNAVTERFSARLYTVPSTGEQRYYINWAEIVGSAPQTSSQRETRIWITESDPTQVHVQSRAIGNIERIERLFNEQIEDLRR